MNCPDRECMISALADGELHGKQKDELETHMKSCPKCKQVYLEMRSLQRGVTDALLDCGEAPDLVSRIAVPVERKPFHMPWIRAWAVASALILIFIAARPVIFKQKPKETACIPSAGTVVRNMVGSRKLPVESEPLHSLVHAQKKRRQRIPHTDRVGAAQKKAHRKYPGKTEPTIQSPVAVEEAKVSVTYEDAINMSTVPNVSQYLASAPEYRVAGTVVAMKGRATRYLLPSQKFDITLDGHASADDDNSMRGEWNDN